jgi:RimJ/RimL family protein N-acetyltransferase
MIIPERDQVLIPIMNGEYIIRPHILSDAPLLCNAVLASHAHLKPWFPWCTDDYSIVNSEQWISSLPAEWQAGQEFAMGIFTADSLALAGGCGINFIQPYFGSANLGYWVHSSYTGRGIATAAAQALAGWTFSTFDFRRIEICMSVKNEASRRTAVAAGAVFEGCLHKRLELYGQYHDTWLYALLRDINNGGNRAG